MTMKTIFQIEIKRKRQKHWNRGHFNLIEYMLIAEVLLLTCELCGLLKFLFERMFLPNRGQSREDFAARASERMRMCAAIK